MQFSINVLSRKLVSQQLAERVRSSITRGCCLRSPVVIPDINSVHSVSSVIEDLFTFL